MKQGGYRRLGTLPPVRKWQLNLFAAYVRFYLSRNFHALHLLRLGELEQLRSYPLLVCINHPSWWDPLIGLYLTQRFFPERHHYAPIAAEGVAKYQFFERLGFFGIDPATRAGAARFLRIGEAALGIPQRRVLGDAPSPVLGRSPPRYHRGRRRPLSAPPFTFRHAAAHTGICFLE